MTLPIDHPFWLTLLVVVPVAVVSGILIHRRGERLASALGSAAFDRVRSEGAFAVGILAAGFGSLLSIGYAAFSARFPSLAPLAFIGGSFGIAALLSLLALRWSVRMRLLDARELVALNVLWAVAYGVLIPALLTVR